MFKVAIIGCGPRGLSALESLYKEIALQSKKIKVLVFEKSKFPGAGPVYNLNQPDSNWLNVCEREVGIPSREEIVFKNFIIPPFPDYQEWCGYQSKNLKNDAVDRFPLRSHMGKYLNQRFESITSILLKKGLLEYYQVEVTNIDIEREVLQIDTIGGHKYNVDEAVLSIGHQPIELDIQLLTWKNRVSNLDNITLYTQPYPISRILKLEEIKRNSIVAVRGFGLATIDLLRGLTEGMGGKFEIINKETREMAYVKSGKEPESIVPFSLDGLPMAPKPLHKKIDDQYVPSNMELEDYSSHVQHAIDNATSLESPKFLMEAIAPLVVKKYMQLGDKTFNHSFSDTILNEITISWLSDEKYEHELILSKSFSATEMLEKFVGMATGHESVSLDFCIGHVWRHCQPTMYKLLSFAPFPDKLISDIVALDERLKRYSYGPPVDSLQQLIALVKSRIVSLDLVNDPDITLEENGWHIFKKKNSIVANIMINSVLDAPQIIKVESSLPKNLINSSVAEPLHDKLGIRTKKNGTVLKKGVETDIPMAVLGRLAKGTLIGVDAIAECFGDRSVYWAQGVISRLRN